MENRLRKDFFKEQGLWLGAVLAVLLAVGAAVYFLALRPAQEPAPVKEIVRTDVSGIPEASPAGEEAGKAVVPPLPGQEGQETGAAPPVSLDKSDAWLRRHAKSLSPHAGFPAWLQIDRLIRVATVVAVNVAEGVSPRPHLGFLDIPKTFPVAEARGRLLLDPKGYGRYDSAAAVFGSIDARAAARLFLRLKPLFQKAYRDLGYPKGDVEEVFVAAMDRILRAPLVDGDIGLKPAARGINLLYRDARLEGLNPAQKHLVRMGPRNAAMIQDKVREMAEALGVPKDRLPPPVRIAAGGAG